MTFEFEVLSHGHIRHPSSRSWRATNCSTSASLPTGSSGSDRSAPCCWCRIPVRTGLPTARPERSSRPPSRRRHAVHELLPAGPLPGRSYSFSCSTCSSHSSTCCRSSDGTTRNTWRHALIAMPAARCSWGDALGVAAVVPASLLYLVYLALSGPIFQTDAARVLGVAPDHVAAAGADLHR